MRRSRAQSRGAPTRPPSRRPTSRAPPLSPSTPQSPELLILPILPPAPPTHYTPPHFVRYAYIERGYREVAGVWHAVQGLFSLHNETVNTWTHLLGLGYYVLRLWDLPVALSASSGAPATPTDLLMYSVFLWCACAQMAASTVYHSFRALSPEIDNALLRLDVAGVAAMIVGSFGVGLYEGFFCDASRFLLHLSVIGTALVGVLVLALFPGFQQPRWNLVRNSLLAATVAYGLVPAGAWVRECNGACADFLRPALIRMFGLYAAGFLLFTSRFPEAAWPGHFDLFASSHQLWHLCVFGAGSCWLEGMLQWHGTRPQATGLGCAEGEWGVPAALSGLILWGGGGE